MDRREEGMTLLEMMVVLTILSIAMTYIFSSMEMSQRLFFVENRKADIRQSNRQILSDMVSAIQNGDVIEVDSAGTTVAVYAYDMTPVRTYRLTEAGSAVYRLELDGQPVPFMAVVGSPPFFAQGGDRSVAVNLSYRDSARPDQVPDELHTTVVPRSLSTLLTDLKVETESGDPVFTGFSPAISYYAGVCPAGSTIEVTPSFMPYNRVDMVVYQQVYNEGSATIVLEEEDLSSDDAIPISIPSQESETTVFLRVYDRKLYDDGFYDDNGDRGFMTYQLKLYARPDPDTP